MGYNYNMYIDELFGMFRKEFVKRVAVYNI